MQSFNNTFSAMQTMMDDINMLAIATVVVLYGIGFIKNKTRTWNHVSVLSTHCMIVFLILHLCNAATLMDNAALLVTAQKSLLLSCVLIALALISIPLQYAIAHNKVMQQPDMAAKELANQQAQRGELDRVNIALGQTTSQLDSLMVEFKQYVSMQDKQIADIYDDMEKATNSTKPDQEEVVALQEQIAIMIQVQTHLSTDIKTLQEKQQKQHNNVELLQRDMQGIANHLLAVVNLVMKLTESNKDKIL